MPRISAVLAAICLTSTMAGAQTAPDISMFPKPAAKMTRHVISLPPIESEASTKVEFRVGKVQQVDCNRHFRGSNLTQMSLTGWGYDYWTARDTRVAATRKGCMGQPKRDAFVGGDPVTVPYNSRLPVIVYAPAGFEVRYRLWSVSGDEMAAPTG
jgi:ecotin